MPGFDSISKHIPGRRETVTGVVLLLACAALAAVAYLVFLRRGRPPEFVRALSSPAKSLTAVVYSPDDRHLVAGSASGQAIVWDLSSGQSRMLESLTSGAILAMAVGPDGSLLAGGVERSLVGWKIDGVGSGKQTRKLAGLSAPITTLAIRPKRTEIAVGLSNGSLYVLGKRQKSLGFPKSQGFGPHVDLEHKGSVKVVRYHPRGDLLVSGGTDGRLVWRDAETRKVRAKRDAHSSEISALAFSPDGRRLASGGWNGEIKIWSVETRELQTTLSQPDAVAGMEWVGSLLVSGSWDGRLRFWSTEREETIGQIDTGAVIHALAVNPAGDTLATVSRRGEVQLWRVPTF